jgi:osmotically-inducible protein OsmY
MLNAPPAGIPRNANHADELLEARMLSLLQSSGYFPLTRLECRVSKGIVELSGGVPTFFLKQVAQAKALQLEGVKGIRNEVVVG